MKGTQVKSMYNVHCFSAEQKIGASQHVSSKILLRSRIVVNGSKLTMRAAVNCKIGHDNNAS